MKKYFPLVGIVAVIILIWWAYNSIVHPTIDATAISGEHKVEIDGDALVIRNETPITVSGQGYFQNVVETETKVYAGETVGWHCTGEPDVEVIKQLNVINQKIHEATLASSTDLALTNDIFSIDNKIFSYTKQISALSAKGDQKKINEIRNEIDLLLERKNNIVSNKTSGKEDVIAQLNKQKSGLERQLGGIKNNLFAPISGIFVSKADGLEMSLNFSSAETLTPAVVQDYLSRKEYKADETIYPYPVCKITDNSEWLLATVCSKEKAGEVSVGQSVTVSFPDEGDRTLRCKIYKISEEEDGQVVLYIIGTNEIYNILTARKIKINILLEKYEGLRIPATAIKSIDGKDFVEIEKAGGSYEAEVTVLYKDEEFAIVKEGGELSMYDKVRAD